MASLQHTIAALHEAVRQLQLRADYLLPPAVLAAASRSVFLLHLGEAAPATGTGVFFERGVAITADHNLGDLRVGDACYGTVPGVRGRAPAARLRFRVAHRHRRRAAAVLRCDHDYEHFLERYTGPPSGLVSRQLALVSFQYAIQGELEADPNSMFDASVGVFTAMPAKLSARETHALYQSTTWAGDSGAALLMLDGQLAGIHLAVVNDLKSRMEQAASLDERVADLESSVNSMISGASAGCLALLSNAFAAR